MMLLIFIQLEQNITQERYLVQGFLIPYWLNNPLTSCSLINLNFLLLQIGKFDKSIVFPLVVFKTLRSALQVYVNVAL